MSTMLQDCPPVQMAYEEFDRFRSDPEIREIVRARERFLTDQRLKLAGAKREGLAEGEAIGMSKGETKKNRENATAMKQEGFDPAVIARITGLSPAEIERLG